MLELYDGAEAWERMQTTAVGHLEGTMRPAEAYAQLRGLGGPVVRTREAAALWRSEEGTARRRLQVLAEAGLVTPIRRGLWSVEADLDPFAVAPYLTAPYLPTFPLSPPSARTA